MVSVIIPVYQVSDYIERCIRSVMGQSYTDIECIIVDDATKDDSIKKCERLIGGYDGSIKFVIIHHQQRRGLSAARNTGINEATGAYIFFLDGDDEITPDCLEKLVRPVHKDTSIEMVKGVTVRYNEDGSYIPLTKQVNQQEGEFSSIDAVRDYHFKRRLGVAAWNKLIKKDFLKRNLLYFQEGFIFEDTLWTFFVVKYLCHLYVIPEVTYFYHKRSGSITTGMNKKERARNWCLVYEEIAGHFTVGECGREAKFYVRNFCSRCANYLESKSFSRASHQLEKALVGKQYKKERTFLALTVFMLKTAVGRHFFILALKLRAFLKVKEIWLNKQC